MSHIFISYSHTDSDYAHNLANTHQRMGFAVWIDARVDYGSQWPHEIEKQLDSCAAFILLMSPRAFASDWVQSELQRAKRKYKPIFPLLLEGDEPWLSVESTQYYDVRDGQLPDERFFSALSKYPTVSRNTGAIAQVPRSSAKSKPAKPEPRVKTEIWVAIIGAGATLCAAGITVFFTIIQPGMSAELQLTPTVSVPTPVVPTNTEVTPTIDTLVLAATSTFFVVPTDTDIPPTQVPPTVPTPTPLAVCERYNTVPLKLYFQFQVLDNFTTATNIGEEQAKAAGYIFIRIEGYIFSDQALGTVRSNSASFLTQLTIFQPRLQKVKTRQGTLGMNTYEPRDMFVLKE